MGPLNASSVYCSQFYLQGPCEAGNDLVLHLQEIGAIGIELIGPQMRACLGVYELGMYPYLIAAALFAPLQHVADAEVLADLLHVHGLALVGEGGAARDHERAADPRKARGQLFGDCIGTIVRSCRV